MLLESDFHKVSLMGFKFFFFKELSPLLPVWNSSKTFVSCFTFSLCFREKFQVFLEYREIVFSHLTLIVNSKINLMSKSYHICERMKYYSPTFKNAKNYVFKAFIFTWNLLYCIAILSLIDLQIRVGLQIGHLRQRRFYKK